MWQLCRKPSLLVQQCWRIALFWCCWSLIFGMKMVQYSLISFHPFTWTVKCGSPLEMQSTCAALLKKSSPLLFLDPKLWQKMVFHLNCSLRSSVEKQSTCVTLLKKSSPLVLLEPELWYENGALTPSNLQSFHLNFFMWQPCRKAVYTCAALLKKSSPLVLLLEPSLPDSLQSFHLNC